MRIFRPLAILLPLALFLSAGTPLPSLAFAQEVPLDEEGHLIQFERDIAPLLRDHCLECHGPEEAKAGFRVDDRELVLGYLVPEEPESSTLYVDYLASTDADYLMPPKAHNGPLSTAQLALIRVWIEEGAEWPEDATVATAEAGETGGEDEANATVDAEGSSLEIATAGSWPSRIWAFQGYFHPAAVHFPIALLSVGGLFVVMGLKWPAMGTQVPLACLLLGAASSVAASLMGWSFASELGYMSLYDAETEIFWHRWSGVVVSAFALVLAAIALVNLRRCSPRLRHVWKTGLVVLAILIGMVGHQGGELHYGKDFYPTAFEKLLGKPLGGDEVVEPTSEEESATAET